MNTHADHESIRVLGDRVRDLRMRVGLGQKELSQRVNDLIGKPKKGSQSHIGNIEGTEGKMPSVQVLWALAIILETSTDYLLGLTNDDRPLGNADDQVVVTVEDHEERKVVQEVAELMARASHDEKLYVAGLVRRLLPKKPRIVGDE